jgi:hypothetical protein
MALTEVRSAQVGARRPKEVNLLAQRKVSRIREIRIALQNFQSSLASQLDGGQIAQLRYA